MGLTFLIWIIKKRTVFWCLHKGRSKGRIVSLPKDNHSDLLCGPFRYLTISAVPRSGCDSPDAQGNASLVPG